MDLPPYHPDQLSMQASAEKDMVRKLLISIFVLGCVTAFIVYVRRADRHTLMTTPHQAPAQTQNVTPWSPPPGQSIDSISGQVNFDASFVVTSEIGSAPTIYHTYRVLPDGTATPLGIFLQHQSLRSSTR